MSCWQKRPQRSCDCPIHGVCKPTYPRSPTLMGFACAWRSAPGARKKCQRPERRLRHLPCYEVCVTTNAFIQSAGPIDRTLSHRYHQSRSKWLRSWLGLDSFVLLSCYTRLVIHEASVVDLMYALGSVGRNRGSSSCASNRTEA
jgi:hypothetical protein